ncbi:Uu.00g030780.m01.CDS01 [Anthostomella pinea]|uniref:Uu.00g030780.m01.CDS01 n=1 Tax=Anthostomella pinea TaxID=933095 RepID=A0AAI8V8E1_9PEZI|nr:Uu.00g030780.m01.CDS01 [Anthostomella pinea]
MALFDDPVGGILPKFSGFNLFWSIGGLYALWTLYTAFANPLSSVPGPLLSRWTDLHVRLRLLNGSKARYMHSLHEQYGPVFRVGPNSVDVSDVAGARDIHKARFGYLKDPNFYVGANMAKELETKQCTDILHWWTLFAMGVISELCFGESFHMLEIGKKNQYAEDIAEMGALLPLRGAFPWLIWLAGYVPLFKFFNNVAHTRHRIVSYGANQTAAYMKLVENNPGGAQRTLFSSLYITAGTDTTAVTLTYLIYAVSRDKEVHDKLIRELQTLPEDFTHRHVRELPYLNLELEETFRLYGASQGALPRVIPPEAGKLAGFHLPGGASFSTQNYSMHRNEEAFPDPEKFDPSRWETPTDKAKNAFMPFGIGPRNCIGLNLARMELRLCTALFFRAFPTAKPSSKDGMPESEMEPHINFLVMPRGHRCLIEVE